MLSRASCSKVLVLSRRAISSKAARDVLDLPKEPCAISLKLLRQAYFMAAKQCHPDVKKDSQLDFVQLTEAYELLQREVAQDNSPTSDDISYHEEQEFRQACLDQLGLQAEVVEECKKSPTFRRWLNGRTDSAYHWRSFLSMNGGLMPKLTVPLGSLTQGSNVGASTSMRATRRRKR